MANRIKIRHGNSIPTTSASSLLPYELGWNTANKILYINDNNNAIEGIGLRYINTTDNTTWTADTLGATTSIAFTRTDITGAHATGHIVWLNANDIGTPFQLVVHDSSELYLYKRWKSSGTWSSWTKMNAGYADSAGSLDNQVLTFGNISYSTTGSGTTTDNETNRKAFIKYICDHYSNAALHIGTYNPNSKGPCLGNIYDVSDISNGYPRYSTFIYHNLAGGLVSFGTSNYNYYERSYVYNSGTWGISITGNAAGLVDGSNTMTSAYNKAGLEYANYTWLAGWNGYELRAVAKTQFAQASHTHDYLPLSGGTVTGTLTVGVSKATSSSDHALWTTGITVHDTRYDTIAVNSLSKAVNFFFTTTGMPDSNWWAGMHVAGWTDDYNAWELVGPADNTDQRTKNLCIRVGRTSTGWGSWRALVTSSDTISRRIFVAPAGTTTPPSGAVNGDIVLVKA